MEKGSSISYQKEVQTSQKRTHVPSTYLGKNPMTKTHWRRFQRKRKVERETTESRNIRPQPNTTIGKEAKLMKKKSSSQNMKEETDKLEKETPLIEDGISIDDFDSESDPSMDVVCNVISVFPVKYKCETEVEEPPTSEEAEMARRKPILYYVLNNGCVKK